MSFNAPCLVKAWGTIRILVIFQITKFKMHDASFTESFWNAANFLKILSDSTAPTENESVTRQRLITW